MILLQQQASALCGVEPRDDDVVVIEGGYLHIPPMIFPEVGPLF